MNYVGIDIGSTASKVVVRGDNEMYFVLPTGWSSKETTNIIRERLKNAGVDVTAQETKVVATGYGRVAVDFADKVITEITCHARGGRELAGGDCTIIDVGGQDTKVIQVSNGVVMDFLMNDKCLTLHSFGKSSNPFVLIQVKLPDQHLKPILIKLRI